MRRMAALGTCLQGADFCVLPSYSQLRAMEVKGEAVSSPVRT